MWTVGARDLTPHDAFFAEKHVPQCVCLIVTAHVQGHRAQGRGRVCYLSACCPLTCCWSWPGLCPPLLTPQSLISQKFHITEQMRPRVSLPTDLFYGGQILDNKMDKLIRNGQLATVKGERVLCAGGGGTAGGRAGGDLGVAGRTGHSRTLWGQRALARVAVFAAMEAASKSVNGAQSCGWRRASSWSSSGSDRV